MLLKKAAPFVVIIFLMSLHNRFDGFLLERLHPSGASEAGVYAAAYRLLDAGSMFGYLAASFIVPFIARNKKDGVLVQNVVLSVRHVLLIAGITVVLFLAFFSDWVQNALYYSSEEYNATILLLCVAALPAYFLTHIYGSVLTASGLLHKFIFIIAFSVVMNVLLNLLFLREYGAAACCLSAIASQYFCGIACIVSVYKNIDIPVNIFSFLNYLMFALLLILLFYFGRSRGTNEILLLTIACGIGALGMFAALYSIRKKFLLLH